MAMPNSESPILVILFSNYSQRCEQLRSTILSDQYLKYFKPICIDNKVVRNAIQNSSLVKISCVPCLLHVYPDGNIATFEDQKAFDWIANFIKSLNKSIQSHGLPTSKVSDLIPQIDDNKENFIKSNELRGQQARKPSQISIPEKSYPMRKPFKGVQDHENFSGIMSNRDIQNDELQQPIIGDGHMDMRSSLPGMGRNIERNDQDFELNSGIDPDDDNESEVNNNRQQVAIEQGKKGIMMIEDITPPDDEFSEDPSGMKSVDRVEVIPIADSQSGKQSKDVIAPMGKKGGRQDKGAAVKNLAITFAKAREAEEKKQEEYKQGTVRAVGNKMKNTPVSL
jgi:hypothetical protein